MSKTTNIIISEGFEYHVAQKPDGTWVEQVFAVLDNGDKLDQGENPIQHEATRVCGTKAFHLEVLPTKPIRRQYHSDYSKSTSYIWAYDTILTINGKAVPASQVDLIRLREALSCLEDDSYSRYDSKFKAY